MAVFNAMVCFYLCIVYLVGLSVRDVSCFSAGVRLHFFVLCRFDDSVTPALESIQNPWLYCMRAGVGDSDPVYIVATGSLSRRRGPYFPVPSASLRFFDAIALCIIDYFMFFKMEYGTFG
jgi:hypothetical protein